MILLKLIWLFTFVSFFRTYITILKGFDIEISEWIIYQILFENMEIGQTIFLQCSSRYAIDFDNFNKMVSYIEYKCPSFLLILILFFKFYVLHCTAYLSLSFYWMNVQTNCE